MLAFTLPLPIGNSNVFGADSNLKSTTTTATKFAATAMPSIVAHRGSSHDAPENTLAAFRLAWQQNADAIEGDFHLTADDQIVCLHDKTTRRTAPAHPNLTAADATLEQLRKLDVGSWKDTQFAGEKMPTLSEVLETVPAGKQIFVEIKCGVEILPILKKQLAACDLDPDQIVLICFSAEVIEEARRTMPAYEANWLTSYRTHPVTRQISPSAKTILRMLDDSSASGFGTQAKMDFISSELVESVHDSGRSIHAWTVDEPGVARELRNLGFDSITTNRPAEIREAIASPVASRE